jgi:hypothetical protein
LQQISRRVNSARSGAKHIPAGQVTTDKQLGFAIIQLQTRFVALAAVESNPQLPRALPPYDPQLAHG